MIYRTLHVYILRDLLRIFLMTASALTTLLAFGGMFKPLTRQGIDVGQVMVLMFNLMPAMLAYAIPIAALFAAVLVYWRMSTDNELTACRAGGVSFVAIVLPAFALGVAVASMDLMFVNYVVPHFLQATERAVRKDLGSWIVNQVDRQERFQYESLVVSADSAELAESGDPNESIVVLHRMSAAFLDKGRPAAMAVAQEARVKIRNTPNQDFAEVSFMLKNGSGFDPANGFRRITGSIDGTEWKRPIPSFFQNKPKFLNWPKLKELSHDPSSFPSVAEVMDQIAAANRYRDISINVQKWWFETASAGQAGRGVTFLQVDSSGEKLQVTLYAEQSKVDSAASADECLTFTGTNNAPRGVKVETRTGGQIESIFLCDAADFVLSPDSFNGSDVIGQLRLRGNVTQQKQVFNQAAESVATPTLISGLSIDPALTVGKGKVTDKDAMVEAKFRMLSGARDSDNKAMRDLAKSADARITKLTQQIISERHSRGSFSVSCLTLVMLGAALGILLRGKNPLAVFVVGFVPAIFLVLLITAGRQLTEQGPHNTKAGITLIWAGNAVLMALVAGVYAKLLRK